MTVATTTAIATSIVRTAIAREEKAVLVMEHLLRREGTELADRLPQGLVDGLVEHRQQSLIGGQR